LDKYDESLEENILNKRTTQKIVLCEYNIPVMMLSIMDFFHIEDDDMA